MDADGSQVHIGQMETPLGVVPEALLRQGDVVSITFRGGEGVVETGRMEGQGQGPGQPQVALALETAEAAEVSEKGIPAAVKAVGGRDVAKHALENDS